MKELAVVVSNDNKNVTPFETIDAIKKAGFKNVFIQWYNNNEWECSQEEQLKYISRQGLNIIFAHLGYQNINNIWLENEIGEQLVERYINDIKTCKENGVDLVIMHLSSKVNPPMYNEIGINRLRKIIDYARTLGVKIAFENTRTEGYLEYVFDNIHSDNIGICYDAGHCHAHFKDKFNWKLFKNKIFAVHLHDNRGTEDEHLIPFDGTIHWEQVVKALQNANYGGPVTLEICYRNEYLEFNVEEFYNKGYETGNKLANIFKDNI